MVKELVVNATQEHLRIALLGDGSLLEYHVDEKKNKITVGDVYLGTVKSLASGMNAAFVDVGHGKDAFLHYSDLGPQFRSVDKFLKIAKQPSPDFVQKLGSIQPEPNIDKFGKIEDVLERGQEIIVQIKKEPICTKGPRLSAEPALAGRYMILLPFANDINISRKIANTEERNRLKRLVTSMRPNNFGVVVRTVAEGKEASDIGEDIRRLIKNWEDGMSKLPTSKPRDRLVGEISRVATILRDVLSASFDKIVVDDTFLYEEIKAYIEKIAPDKVNIVNLHQGKSKLFEQFGIEKQIKLLFGRTVTLGEGGYLVIEHTEAMHVIDVNSGSRSMKDGDQDESVLKINMSAAKEVARQLQLRDMGGIIVVDFIDMKLAEHRQILQDKMQEYLKEDRSKTKMLPISKFGLIQITRQRVRSEMNVNTQEVCSACSGSGKTKSTLTVADDIQKNIEFLLLAQNEKGFTLYLHPYMYSYFTKGFLSIQWRLFLRYRRWIAMAEDSTLAITEYKFFRKDGDEIELG